MIDLLPLTASGVSVPERTPGQFWLTLLLVVLFVGILAVAYRRSRFAKLPKTQRRHKSALLGSIRNATPETVRIPRDADAETYREPLRAAFERAFERARGRDAAHDPDRVTVREASESAARAIADETTWLQRYTPDRLTAGIAVLAVSILVLGVPAVSTDGVVAVLTAEGIGGAELGGGLAVLIGVGMLGAELLGVFPYSAEIVAGLATAATTFGEILYYGWFLSVLLLLTGWLLLYVEDDMRSREFDGPLFDRRALAISIGKRVAVIWTVGVGVALPFQLVGVDSGRMFGVAAAGGLVGYYCYRGICRLSDRIEAITGIDLLHRGREYEPSDVVEAAQHAGEELDYDPASAADRLEYQILLRDHSVIEDLDLAVYILARRLFGALAIVLAPVPLLYLYRGVTTGAYGEVARSLVSGGPVAMLVLLAFAGLLAAIAYLARDAHEEIRDALTEAFARQSVRVLILQRGLTIGALIGSYGILWAFTRSVVIAPVGAVTIALATYAAYEATDRAAYRLDLFGADEPPRKSVLIQAYAAEDGDGELHPVAKVGGNHPTSRESIEDTVDDVIEIAPAVARRTVTVPSTAGQQRAEDLLELGLVDGDVETELREQIRETLKYELEPSGRVEIEELEDAMEGYPEEMWRSELDRYELLSLITIDGETVRLERDVWSADEQESAGRWFTGTGS